MGGSFDDFPESEGEASLEDCIRKGEIVKLPDGRFITRDEKKLLDQGKAVIA